MPHLRICEQQVQALVGFFQGCHQRTAGLDGQRGDVRCERQALALERLDALVLGCLHARRLRVVRRSGCMHLGLRQHSARLGALGRCCFGTAKQKRATVHDDLESEAPVCMPDPRLACSASKRLACTKARLHDAHETLKILWRGRLTRRAWRCAAAQRRAPSSSMSDSDTSRSASASPFAATARLAAAADASDSSSASNFAEIAAAAPAAIGFDALASRTGTERAPAPYPALNPAAAPRGREAPEPSDSLSAADGWYWWLGGMRPVPPAPLYPGSCCVGVRTYGAAYGAAAARTRRGGVAAQSGFPSARGLHPAAAAVTGAAKRERQACATLTLGVAFAKALSPSARARGLFRRTRCCHRQGARQPCLHRVRGPEGCR